MTNRSTYEAAILATAAPLATSKSLAEVKHQTTKDAAKTVVGYTLQAGNTAALAAAITAANLAKLEDLANAEKAKQATLAAARDALRTAGGDNSAF